MSQSPNGLNGAFHGVSVILALVATVFVTPRLWPLVSADIWRWLNELYSYETAAWLHLGGQILIWPLSFFAIRLIAMITFTALVLLIARAQR